MSVLEDAQATPIPLLGFFAEKLLETFCPSLPADNLKSEETAKNVTVNGAGFEEFEQIFRWMLGCKHVRGILPFPRPENTELYYTSAKIKKAAATLHLPSAANQLELFMVHHEDRQVASIDIALVYG
jgi:hypothetical protein